MTKHNQDEIDHGFMELLQRFESAVNATGSSVIGNLNPGAEPRYVRELLAQIGMEPSTELVTWFNWHNGYDVASGAYDQLVSWRPHSIEAAIADWEWREHGTEPWEWAPTWLPIGVGGGMPRLAADCTPPQGHDCTVMAVSPDAGLFSEPGRKTRTLAQAVQIWLEAVESGWFTWVQDEARRGWALPSSWNDHPGLEYVRMGIL